MILNSEGFGFDWFVCPFLFCFAFVIVVVLTLGLLNIVALKFYYCIAENNLELLTPEC